MTVITKNTRLGRNNDSLLHSASIITSFFAASQTDKSEPEGFLGKNQNSGKHITMGAQMKILLKKLQCDCWFLHEAECVAEGCSRKGHGHWSRPLRFGSHVFPHFVKEK